MKKIKFLSLDDDPKFNALLEKKIEKTPIELATTSTVKAFLTKVQSSEKWDCFLIDLNLEEGQEAGFTLLRLLREKLKLTIPVIILSRDDSSEKITHALDCGANDYAKKPLDIDLLLTKVEHIIKAQQTFHSSLSTGKVPSGFSSAYIHTEYTLSSIEQFGVTLVGNSCISKGSVLEVSSSLFPEIFNKDSLKLMVTRNSKISENQYRLFLEYGIENQETIAQAKAWFIKKQSHH